VVVGSGNRGGDIVALMMIIMITTMALTGKGAINGAVTERQGIRDFVGGL